MNITEEQYMELANAYEAIGYTTSAFFSKFPINVVTMLEYLYNYEDQDELREAINMEELETLVPIELLVSLPSLEDSFNEYTRIKNHLKTGEFVEDSMGSEFNFEIEEQPQPIPIPQPQPQPQTLSNPEAVEQTDFQMEPRTPLSEEQIAEIFEMESDVLGGSEEESGGLGMASNFEIDSDAQTQEQSTASEPQSQSEASQEPNQTNTDQYLWDSKIKEKFEKKLAYCCNAEFDTARNKRNFIRFTLIDKNGIKVSKVCLFNYTGTKESVQNFVDQIVIIAGEYKQNGTYLNLNLSSVAVVLPESAEKRGISTETFLKIKEANPFERKPQISNETCAEQLLGYIQEMPDADYQKLLKYILVDCKFLEVYSRIPSGLKYHHAVPGGNLQHTYEVTNIAYTLCQQFSYANPNLSLVITGAMLHDIGKTYEMPVGEEMNYTYQGYALGHIAIGISLITRYAIECNIPKVKLNALLSIIAQHHGKVENGSPVPACSIEAMIVHCADVCSCNINHVYQGLYTSDDKVVAVGNEHLIRLQV